jgi:uncharacterized membrane protein YhaH (DUF805 family)
MSFSQAISSGFRNYVNFEDRASRSEFWYWVLFTFLLGLALGAVMGLLGASDDAMNVTSAILTLGLLLPGLGMSVRRVHDVGKTGWILLIAFIPFAGLYLLYLYVQPSQDPNQYGNGPLTAADL